MIDLQKGHPILYISLMSAKVGTMCTRLREKKGLEDKRSREEEG